MRHGNYLRMNFDQLNRVPDELMPDPILLQIRHPGATAAG
jgi:hypothetical protein